MSKFQRKLAEKMGEKTMTISVKDWDKLNDKVEFLKNQNFDLDKYAERLQKELKALEQTVKKLIPELDAILNV